MQKVVNITKSLVVVLADGKTHYLNTRQEAYATKIDNLGDIINKVKITEL
jgi:hypothetical protein